MSCWTREAGERPQRMAILGGYGVLHHLDLVVRPCPRNGEVLHLHHDSTHRIHEEVTRLYCLGPSCCDMGVLPRHLPRNSTLLPAGSRNLDTYVDSERRGHLRVCRHIRYHRTRRYSFDDCNRSGTSRCARGHALEYTDEETGQVSSIWLAIFRVHVCHFGHSLTTILTYHSASIITMVRIPYINKFEATTNLQCKGALCLTKSKLISCAVWVAHTMLCSNIETGIGCIASSVPSLRHFFRRNGDGSSGPSNKRSGTGTRLVTVGGSRQQRRLRDSFRNPTDIGFSLSTVHHGRAEDNWERLDGDSDKSDAPIDPKRIYAERSYAVDIESDSEARQGKYGHPHGRAL